MKRKIHITKWRFFVPALVSVCLLVLLGGTAGILALVWRARAETFTDQQAADRWGAGYMQVSAFLPVGKEVSFETALRDRQTVENELVAASLSAEEGARLWYCAYSGETSVYATTKRGGSATLLTTVCGEDYFLIHQPRLISGAYLGADGGSAGCVLLDANAAWTLFGALDIAGMELSIGDNPYTVCGVCEPLRNSLWDAAYGDKLRAYMYCDAPDVSGTQVTCYEAVLPNPIENFATAIVKKLFSDALILENSARFTVDNLLGSFSERAQARTRTVAYVFPWWENLALVGEYKCASLLHAECALLALCGLIVLVWIGIAWMPATRGIARLAKAIWEGIPDKINTYNYNRKNNPKPKKSKKKKFSDNEETISEKGDNE